MQPELSIHGTANPRAGFFSGGIPASAVAAAGILAAILLVLFGPLPALGLVAVLVGIALIGYPFLAFNILVALSALDAINTLVPSDLYQLTGTKLAGFVLAMALGVDVVLRRSHLRLDAASVILFGFLGGLLASFWVATDLSLALREGLRFFQLAILFFAARHLVVTRDHLETVARVLALSLTVSAVAGIYQFLFSDERISGASQNAAILAADLMVAFAFAIGVVMVSRRRASKIIWTGVCLLLGLCLVMTQSRSAFLALPFAFGAALLVAGRRLRWTLPLFVLAVAGFFAIGGIGPRFVQFAALADTSSQGHMKTLLAGVRMIEDNPMFGVGLGNYIVHYLSYTNDVMGFPKTAHNTYLSFAAECGIPTALLFVLFAGICVMRAMRTGIFWRRRNEAPGSIWSAVIAFSVTAVLVTAFFHTLNTNKYLWLLLGLAAQLPFMDMNGHAHPEDEDEQEAAVGEAPPTAAL